MKVTAMNMLSVVTNTDFAKLVLTGLLVLAIGNTLPAANRR